MDIFTLIFLSIVEGITEFLPVSSTYHLLIVAKIAHLEQSNFLKLFEIFIQSGAILAAVFLYAKKIFTNKHLFAKLLVSFIPTAIMGALLYKVIKNIFFESNLLITSAFVIVGIMFLIIEKRHNVLRLQLNDISYKQALLIGCFQSLALVPGVSRAGAVLVGMMLLGYRRDSSAEYSFMLAIPTIFTATAYDILKSGSGILNNGHNIVFLIIGFLVAFLVAYLVMRWLIEYLKHNSLALFGWYRVIAGSIVMLSLLFFK